MPFERIRKILGKERVLNWNHTEHPGIVWRFPDSSSKNEKERDTSKIDAFQVQIGERAVALMNNEFYEDTPPGTFWLKGEQKKGLEVIYIDQGQFKEPWGIPGTILTKDDQQIGAHGYHTLRIVDPKNFVLSIVSGERAYTSEKINEFIRSYVTGILRQHLADYSVLDGQILREQEEFARAMKAKCHEQFTRWGLELVNLELVEFSLPENVERARAERAQTELQKSLSNEMSLRGPLEEKKMELENRLSMMQIELENARELKELEKQKELETQRSELEVLKKQVEKTVQGIDVGIEQMKAESAKIQAEKEAGRIERIGRAESLVVEMQRKAEIAADLLTKTTDAELKFRESDAAAKRDVDMERIRAEKEVKVTEAKAAGEVGVAEGRAKAEVAIAERQMRAMNEMSEIMAKMAEAVAVGGQEGEATRKGLEARFLSLLAEAGIDVAKREQAISMAKSPPRPYIKIDKEIAKGTGKMTTCSACGQKLEEDAKYCDSCGKKQ